MAIYHWYGADFTTPKEKKKKEQPKLISTRITTSDGRRGCKIEYRDGAVQVYDVPGLSPRVAGYAVLHFFRHCPELCDQLVPKAVMLALRGGLRSKSRNVAIHIRTWAATLGLDSDEIVYIRVFLSPGTITIDSVSDRVRR